MRCCFHEDTQPSLRINLDFGGFHCFGCGEKGGDIVAFHQQRHHLTFCRSGQLLWRMGVRRCQNETPQIAARRLAQTVIAKGYKPEALHAYHDQEGSRCIGGCD